MTHENTVSSRDINSIDFLYVPIILIKWSKTLDYAAQSAKEVEYTDSITAEW